MHEPFVRARSVDLRRKDKCSNNIKIVSKNFIFEVNDHHSLQSVRGTADHRAGGRAMWRSWRACVLLPAVALLLMVTFSDIEGSAYEYRGKDLEQDIP